jgi:hypothetical protein
MYDSYAVVQGVDMILPVDVYVPGCPPRPDAVIDALLKLQRKIERESPVRGLLAGPAEGGDEGSATFFRAPNKYVPTTRSHELVPPGVYQDRVAVPDVIENPVLDRRNEAKPGSRHL